VKILVDENIPIQTVNALSNLGHSVEDIRGTNKQGISDEEIWRIAQNENRLFRTTDKGFSQYRNSSHYGILIVRLKQPNQAKIHYRIMHALKLVREDDWKNLLMIMRDSVQSTWKSNIT